VVREIQRVQSAANALRRNDLALFGMFMSQSHQSLRDDFAVSTPELDTIVEAARSIGDAGGVYGARLTGAGFGGSAIVFADAARPGVIDRVGAAFQKKYRRVPPAMRVASAAGASIVPAARWRTA
jgi:galactokinase